jgi:hypothetical protein
LKIATSNRSSYDGQTWPEDRAWQRCNPSAASGPKSKGALVAQSAIAPSLRFWRMRKISGGLRDWSPKNHQTFPIFNFPLLGIAAIKLGSISR